MSDLLKLRDFVYAETGMFFPDEKQYYFEPRFKRRMETLKLSSYQEYFDYLKRDNGRRGEFTLLMNELTINETSFFRNMPQWDGFREVVIPGLLKTKEDKIVKNIRVWSAGCSSGEEAYTLAMIFHELRSGPLAGWNIEIRATDISTRVLEMAQKRIYREYQIQGMPEYFRNKYIEQVDGVYRVKEFLAKYITFSQLNLCDDMAMIFMKGFDVVFCRNVLIYFDLQSKKRVLQHFFNSLVMDGYLFIGFSESLYGIDDRFKLIHYPGGMVYRKSVHI